MIELLCFDNEIIYNKANAAKKSVGPRYSTSNILSIEKDSVDSCNNI